MGEYIVVYICINPRICDKNHYSDGNHIKTSFSLEIFNSFYIPVTVLSAEVIEHYIQNKIYTTTKITPIAAI